MNPTNTVLYLPEPRAEVYCLQQNFKISKLSNWQCEGTTIAYVYTHQMRILSFVTLFGKTRLNENSVEAFFRCNAFSAH